MFAADARDTARTRLPTRSAQSLRSAWRHALVWLAALATVLLGWPRPVAREPR